MKWTVTHRGIMIITITVIGESCLPPRATNETWEYEYTFNFHSNKKNQWEKKKKTHKRKQVSCENRGLKQQTAIFSGLILISQLSECLLLIYMLVCAGGKWCQGIYTFELSSYLIGGRHAHWQQRHSYQLLSRLLFTCHSFQAFSHL